MHLRHVTQQIGLPAMLAIGLVAMARTQSVWAQSGEVMQVPEQIGLGLVAYYTFAATVIVVYAIGMLVTRSFQELAYALYGMLIMFLVAAMDGTLAFAIGGSNWWMLDAPLLIGALTACVAYLHVAVRLPAEHWLARTRPLMLALAVLSMALVPGYFLVPSMRFLYAVLNTLLLLMVFSQVFAAHTRPVVALGGLNLAYVWPVLLGLAMVVLYSIDLGGEGFSQADIDQINRILILAHLLHLMVVASLLVYANVAAKQEAERKALEAARETAEVTLQLERSQHEYERIQRVAQDRSRQLASASHDLRQPIAALRQAILDRESQSADQPSKEARRINDAIDYLDQLASTYLDAGKQGLSLEELQDETNLEVDDGEWVDLSLIVQTVHAMFVREAQEHNVDLQYRSLDVKACVNPLVVTRILANAVSNALSHAKASRILMTVRHSANGLRLEVRDNGIGMTPAEQAQALTLGQRGDESEGHGLGLAIIAAMAEENDWTLGLRSAAGAGTTVFLLIPKEPKLA